MGVPRRAGPRDLDRVAALWSALGDHHAPLDPLFRPRAGAEDAVRALVAGFLRDPDTAVFVCEAAGDAGGLVGFCAARIERAPPILAEDRRAEITDLFVDPEARRRGVGRALATAALDWVAGRGVRRVEVRVAVHNEVGQAFWRALGFGDLIDVLHRRL